MDQKLVYAKTPIGDEAVRQRKGVVRRNLRMVLVQINGKISVEELGAKLGNPSLVENALRDLERGGYIAPSLQAASVWQESKLQFDKLKESGESFDSGKSLSRLDSQAVSSAPSAFGEPILPASWRTKDVKENWTERHASRAPRHTLLVYLVFGLVAAGLVATAVLAFFPYGRFKPAIENELTRVWQVPVRVGDIRLNLMPEPGLLLTDVRIGEGDESLIENIRVHTIVAMLGSGVQVLPRIEISGGAVAADHLVGLFAADNPQRWKSQQWLLKQVVVENLSVTAGSLFFAELSGDVTFHADGRIEQASLRTIGNTLRITAEPTPQGATLQIDGVGWRPAEEFPLTFDSLHASGLLHKGRLIISSFDIRALGGGLKGSWLVEWNEGLAMIGDAMLERLSCRKVTAVFAPSLSLEGDLMGSFRMHGAGRDWESMWENMDGALDALIVRGVLNGANLAEATRRGRGSIVRAGSTKFDRLAVSITINRRQISGRSLVMDAEQFAATGQFFATRDRRVDSKLLVSTRNQGSSQILPVRVSGTLPSLVAVVR
ncbi:MAG: hypothetical protein IPN75_11045 [Dechloromonas sp.]|uniref:AsmA-like C-terminal domain-containing protein n=1 Tax=Candidatus Dechloromonas phosphorivorans TaxID=2899244 RepID=A0A9D7LRJ8_9RHOO|nr:hypothetical protein [Candidatus Dechloromonas phosphorivorans]